MTTTRVFIMVRTWPCAVDPCLSPPIILTRASNRPRRRAHAWLLSLLLRSQTLAEAQLQHCTDFYLLFAHAVTSLPTPSEVWLAIALHLVMQLFLSAHICWCAS